MKIIDCATGEERDATPDEEADTLSAIYSTIPEVVSARQMKLALLGAGLLDGIEAFVVTQDRAVQISWEYATEFRRDDPMLVNMAEAFSMTYEQVDDVFRAAAQI